MKQVWAVAVCISLVFAGVASATDFEVDVLVGQHDSMNQDHAQPGEPEANASCDHCCHGCNHPTALGAGSSSFVAPETTGPMTSVGSRFASLSYPPPLKPPSI
jgi:hypothetical protein